MLNQAKITISVIFWVVAGYAYALVIVFAIDYLPITSSSGGNKKQADQGGLAFIKPQQDNYNNAIGANKNVLLATPYCFPSAKGSNSNLLGAGTPVNPQIATPSADSKASFSPATNGNTSDGTSTPYVSGDPLSIPTSTCKSNQQKANSTPQTLPISQSLSALGLKASNSVVFFDKKSGVSFGEKKINARINVLAQYRILTLTTTLLAKRMTLDKTRDKNSSRGLNIKPHKNKVLFLSKQKLAILAIIFMTRRKVSWHIKS